MNDHSERGPFAVVVVTLSTVLEEETSFCKSLKVIVVAAVKTPSVYLLIIRLSLRLVQVLF
jgi:hypothetical protein